MLSPSNYRLISELAEEGTSIYDYDLAMTMNASRYEFKVKSRKARWKLDPAVAKAVEEAAQPFVRDGGVKLGKRLGKKITLLEWKSLLAGAPAKEVTLDDGKTSSLPGQGPLR